MAYSMNLIFIDTLGKQNFIDAVNTYAVAVSSIDSNKDQPKLLIAKNKFLADIFGALPGEYPRSSVNNLFNGNRPKWRLMTDHIRNRLVEDRSVFERFLCFMESYRDKNEHAFAKAMHSTGVLIDFSRFNESADEKLKNVIRQLAEINSDASFIYMLYLLTIISVFHEDLTNDMQLAYLYSKEHISKYIPQMSRFGKSEKTSFTPLSSPKPIPKKIFGRDTVIDDIAKRLNEDHVVFLQGVGGIGKTQVVKNFISQYRNNYDTVIFGTFADSLTSLLISNAFEFEPKISRKTLPDGSKETDSAFAARKLQKMKSLSNERTLIVIDNFDTLSDDFLEMLIDGRYHLLITTRCDYSEFYPSVQISELNGFALKELFYYYYNDTLSNENDALLVELFKLLGKHTYTVELVAKHLANSGETVGECTEALKRQGLSSLSKSVRTNGSSMDTGYNTIRNLFRIFSLDEESKKILAYLSLVPLTGISHSDLKRWAKLPSLQKTNDLIQRSLIQETENKKIALHPIIKDLVAHEYPPERESAEKFFLHILKDISDFKYRNMSMDKIEYYADILEHHSPADMLMNYNDNLHTVCFVLNHAEKYERSLAFAEKCLEMAKKFSGETSACTAKWYFRMSELQNLFNKDTEANLLEKAASIAENHETDIDSIYVSIRLAATKNAEDASRLLQKALSNLKPLTDQQGVLVPNGHIMQLELYNQLSKLYLEKIRDHDRALRFAVSAKDALAELSLPDYALFAWEARIFSTLALAYSKTDNAKLALSTVQQALESAKKCYGDDHFLCIKCKIDVCRIYLNLNMLKEALPLLENLKTTLQAKDDFDVLLSRVTSMLDEIENQSF